jgi:hypothetical protein
VFGAGIHPVLGRRNWLIFPNPGEAGDAGVAKRHSAVELLGDRAGKIHIVVKFRHRDFDADFGQAERVLDGQSRGRSFIVGVLPVQHEQAG